MTTAELLVYFEKVTKKMVSTCAKKNSDYANYVNPFSNFSQVEILNICSTEKGFLTRMTDKMSRIINLINKRERGKGPAVSDESINDTLLDLANYCILLSAYLESKKTVE